MPINHGETLEPLARWPPFVYLPDRRDWVNLNYVIGVDTDACVLLLDCKTHKDTVPLSVNECALVHQVLEMATNPPWVYKTVEPVERPEGVNWAEFDKAFSKGEQ